MNRLIGGWKVRQLVTSWCAYWATLAAVTLAPAALAIWTVSHPGLKGDASAATDNCRPAIASRRGTATGRATKCAGSGRSRLRPRGSISPTTSQHTSPPHEQDSRP